MSEVSDWSVTAANNNDASPDGFPEGMAPSGVNDSAREVMAAVRRFYNDISWNDDGNAHSYVSATSFKIAGQDVTSTYHVGRRVRIVGATTGTIYRTITSTTFSTDTTVVVDSGTIQNETLTVSLGDLFVNPSFPLNPSPVPALSSHNVLAPSKALVCGRSGLNTVDVDADEMFLTDGTNHFLAKSVNLTIDIGVSGANGIDTGGEAASTWYHFWVIAKPDQTVAGLLSLSATAPTMPSGYTYKGYAGAVYNNSGSDFILFGQRGDYVSIIQTVVLTDGAATTYTALALNTTVPTTAKICKGQFLVRNTSGNAASGFCASDTVGSDQQGNQQVVTSANNNWISVELTMLSAQTGYYKTGGAAGDLASFYVHGWKF